MYLVTQYTEVTFVRDGAGALELFKGGNLYRDEPAEASDQCPVVKCIVHTEPQQILVGVPVTREMVDWKGLEEWIAREARAAAAQTLTVHERKKRQYEGGLTNR